MYKDKVKKVSKKEDVPKGQHYAIIIYKSSSVYIPGDERSRTNPGHGYPAHSETFESFEHWVTEDKVEWESLIKALHISSNNFIFFEVPKLGSLEVNVSIK